MRARSLVGRLWRGEGGTGPVLMGALTAPLAVIYGSVVRTRNFLYRLGVLSSSDPPLPVVSVGNLAVGGTGKTPVSGWLAGELERLGRRPAIVMRGYGEDEVRLHRRWSPATPVIVTPRRIDGVREALRLGRGVAVLDDGFQHRSLRRDLDIVLLSPVHPLPPRLLPRGPFRESLRALRRAGLILITSKGEGEREAAVRLAAELRRAPGLPPVDLCHLEAGAWERLDGSRGSPPDAPVLAVASVAEPCSFLALVRARLGEAPEARLYPDHHLYTRDDAARIARQAEGRAVVTTEKDAVKLEAFAELLPPVRVLPLVAVPGDGLIGRILGSLPGEAAPGPGEARA
ncbi:MAG: tetraacyldisaccharide 4'-kinase [Gammaproteobacteria bacterium]|nr:tetraacyldisaccharide 4'-kinase [Gammaproteobacteria bacterium]